MSEPTDVERLAEIEKRLEEQPDGSIKVTLFEPVGTEGGGRRASLVVRPVTYAAIRAARRTVQRTGDLDDDALADQLVEPEGVWEGIAGLRDVELIRKAVNDQMGKYLGPGRASS